MRRLNSESHEARRLAVVLMLFVWSNSICPLVYSSATPRTAPKAGLIHAAERTVDAPARSSSPANESTRRTVIEQSKQLPLGFEVNEGQRDPRVKFLSRGNGYKLFLTPEETVMVLSKNLPRSKKDNFRAVSPPAEVRSEVLRMKLVNSNPRACMMGIDELPGKTNYFIGNDPSHWKTDVPNYAKVRYEQVYPGIDLVYYGNQQQLEYDLIVSPGADPNVIRLSFEGAKRISINRNGDLVLTMRNGEVRQQKPVLYQMLDDRKQLVTGRYVITRKNQIAIQVGAYDRTRPLVIDPVLAWATFLGGTSTNGGDATYDIDIDTSGNAYVTGTTNSTDFPTNNPYQGYGGGTCFGFACFDAYVTKINASGSARLYSTYIGGNQSDFGYGLRIDNSGSAYITGITNSPNFPTLNALQSTLGGNDDAFVVKLSATGNALSYATYLGGSGYDQAEAIDVDTGGNAYVTGSTDSPNFPTLNAYQGSLGNTSNLTDVFVTKLSAAGNALVYSTYLGGDWHDGGYAIVVDSLGSAYVTGSASSSNFPVAAALYSTLNGSMDAFITKLSPLGNSLVFSTLLGGQGDERGYGIALDSSLNIYVTGEAGFLFPTVNAYDSTFGGGQNFQDAFLTKIDATGGSLVYSTYLGGSGDEVGYGVAVDASGRAYVVGTTFSSDFPKVRQLQSFLGGSDDFFITMFDNTGNVTFSTYLGGFSSDEAYGIAVDNDGNAYVAGGTASSNFPVKNSLQTFKGNGDGVVLKITGLISYNVSGRVTDAVGGGLSAVTMTLSGGQTGSTQTDSGGFYTFADLPAGGNYTVTPSKAPYTFVPANRTFNNLNSNQTGDFTVATYSLSGRVTNASGAGVSAATLTLSGTQAGTTQTDASGNYSFATVAAGGNYVLTPSKLDALVTYTFNPTTRSVTNLNANTTGLDFTSSVSIISTVNPIGDAYVQDGSAANTNFGTATTMLVRTDNQTNNGLNRDAYLMFDVDGVSGSISSVKLRFFAALSQSGSVTTAAYSGNNTTWKESGSGSITWNNKPGRGANPLGTVVVTGTTFATYDVDVTTYVRDEKLAGRNKVSLVLHDASPVTPHITLNSREAATNKPRLIVTTSATSNAAPAVSITSPAPGAPFTAPASIAISSNASDSDGSISSVKYYAGTQFINSSSTAPSYGITWSGVAAGTYTLFAVATDNTGATTTSSPVTVNVGATNNPPTVSLDSPLNGTIFSAGSNIALRAKPTDSDGSINKVEFFAGSTLVGTATTPDVDNLYSVTWNNVASGAYALTARATDNANGVTNSSEVNISVVSQTGLSPVFDAYVRDGSSASTNFGTAAELQVQASATAGSNREAHLRFDLTAVSGIARAKLRLYGKLSDTSGTNVPLGAYAVSDTTWTETGLTWNNKPATGTLQSSTTITDNVARWYEFDVTSHVKGEKDLNHNAVSLAVKALANSSPYATFSSKEANLATDIRPQLIIWTTQARNALLVVGSSNLGVGDNAVKTRLQNLGYTVTAKVANNSLLSTDADGKTVIVISSTVTATSVGTKFRHTSVPVVNWEFDIFDDMGMTGAVANMDLGTSATTVNLNIINSTHALAAGLALGQQQVLNTGSATAFTWGNPTVNAAKIATVVGDANKIVIFGYDGGAAMTGLNAPARRVGLFMTDVTANNFNPNGNSLFDAAIKWATELITKPVINSVTPANGPTGTTVTVTGINFGISQGTSTLTFNGVAASPTSWTDKTIVSSVPLFASTGPVVVSVKAVASNGLVFSVGAIDSDADGLPDNWEIQYFGNLSQTAAGDPDGDGITNLQEFQQGRNPTKSALTDPGDFVNLKVHTPLSP